MTRRCFWLLLLLFVALAAVPAAAQEELVVGRIALGAAPCLLRTGSGSPEGAVTGNVCDIYVQADAGTIYSKTSGSGNTGWTGQASAFTAQGANKGFFGPTSGSDQLPTFRYLVKADQVNVTAYTDAANIFTQNQQIAMANPLLTLTRTATNQYATLDFTTNATDEWAVGVADTATPRFQFVSGAGGGTTVVDMTQAGAVRLPFSLATPRVYADTSTTLTLGGTATGGPCTTNPPTTANCEALTYTLPGAYVEQRLKTDTSYRTRWYVSSDAARLQAWNGGGWMPLALDGGPTQLGGGGVHVGSLAGTVDPGLGNARWDGWIRSTSPAYASQTTGMAVDFTDGSIDARYIYTDELHAKAFIADLEQALAGGQIIAKSVGVLGAPFTAPAAGGTATLTMRDLPSAENMAIFESGDYIRIRQFDRSGGQLSITDAWGTVSGYADQADKLQTWTFTRLASNSGAMTAGSVINIDAIVLDYGVSGNGFLESNAIDGLRGINSPYHQVVTWSGSSPYSGNQTIRTRLGNLRGITGTTGEYGLLAGSYAASNGQYIKASSQGVELHGIDLALWNGSTRVLRFDHATPYQSMGNPAPTTYGSGTGCWSGLDSGTFKWRCGDIAGGTNYIAWDGSNLDIRGSVTITSISGLNYAGASSPGGAATSATIASTITGQGALATANSVAWASQITGIPGTLATPSGTGLFLSATNMGYYDSGTWKTYMDSSGNFYLGGTSGKLTWNAGTNALVIDGTGTFSGTGSFSAGNVTLDSSGVRVVGNASNAWSAPNAYSFTVSNGKLGMSGVDGGGSRRILNYAEYTGTGDHTSEVVLYVHHNPSSGGTEHIGSIDVLALNAGSQVQIHGTAVSIGDDSGGGSGALTVAIPAEFTALAFRGTVSSTHAFWALDVSSNHGVISLGSTGTGAEDKAQFYNGNGLVGTISTSGSATSYNTSSDVRLKTDIRPTAYGLADLLKIDVRDFAFKADPSRARHTGFLAQQLYAVFPDPVYVPELGGMWQVDYSKLTPLLVKAVQELTARVAALEKDKR